MDIKARIVQLDKAKVYESIRSLSDQINQVINDTSSLTYPSLYKEVSCIAISGMGGSIYNYFVINSLFSSRLSVPLLMVNGYDLPSYVGQDTLFIGSSYSGTTEETIASTKKAYEKDVRAITAVTSGGLLGNLMNEHNSTFYQFNPKFNPCGQPRVGLGYMIFGPIMILEKLSLLEFPHDELSSAIARLKKDDQMIQDTALNMKDKVKDMVVIFVASEHLLGNAHIARNQFNETAKAFAQYHPIPELNHHLMEGLQYPKDKNLLFVFFESPFYGERNRKRINVTKQILDKQSISHISVSFDTSSTMEEFLLFLQWGSYLSFFLGIEYGVDPSLIPWVDYFKKELGK